MLKWAYHLTKASSHEILGKPTSTSVCGINASQGWPQGHFLMDVRRGHFLSSLRH